MYVEVKSWVARCDICNAQSEVFHEVGHPRPNAGWKYVEKKREMDDSYAPQTKRILVCPECAKKT